MSRPDVAVVEEGPLDRPERSELAATARSFGAAAAAYLAGEGPLGAVDPARPSVRRDLASLRTATSSGRGEGRLLGGELAAQTGRSAIAHLQILTRSGVRSLSAALERHSRDWRVDSLLVD